MATTNQQGIIQKNATSKVAQKKPQKLKDYVDLMSGEIAKALPTGFNPGRFSRMALTAISNNPLLEGCTPKSFLAAMMNAAQLGLEPNTPLGQAYLIPYKNKGILECQFQIGYKGLIDLAYRSGEMKVIMAQTVYENDEFDFSFGLNPTLKHVPAKKDRGNPVWFYAVFKLVNGGEGFEVMSVEDVRKHAQKYSQSYNSAYSPWKKNFEEMAKKTAIKQALKYAPMKTDFARAVSQDETIKHEIDFDMSQVPDEYVDVEYEETEYNADPETGEVKDELTA